MIPPELITPRLLWYWTGDPDPPYFFLVVSVNNNNNNDNLNTAFLSRNGRPFWIVRDVFSKVSVQKLGTALDHLGEPLCPGVLCPVRLDLP